MDVLIVGEPGSGKETAAEALRIPERPCVILDCRAPPAALLEVALFGMHRNNCFSSSGPTIRTGVFEEAADGIVVLDELAALPREVHGQLTRTLERRRIRAIGSNQYKPFAARVIATTHDPAALAPHLRARFTEQQLPPLRDRLGELAPDLPRAAIARLAPLHLDLATVHRLARAPDPEAAIRELELLAAIAAEDGDASRRVYADLLLANDDPRGELIHVQCELARRTSHRLRTRETELLALYGPTWLAPVLAIPHVSSAVLRRGFVEVVRGPADVIRAIDVLRRAAPALREVYADGVAVPLVRT